MMTCLLAMICNIPVLVHPKLLELLMAIVHDDTTVYTSREQEQIERRKRERKKEYNMNRTILMCCGQLTNLMRGPISSSPSKADNGSNYTAHIRNTLNSCCKTHQGKQLIKFRMRRMIGIDNSVHSYI